MNEISSVWSACLFFSLSLSKKSCSFIKKTSMEERVDECASKFSQYFVGSWHSVFFNKKNYFKLYKLFLNCTLRTLIFLCVSVCKYLASQYVCRKKIKILAWSCLVNVFHCRRITNTHQTKPNQTRTQMCAKCDQWQSVTVSFFSTTTKKTSFQS